VTAILIIDGMHTGYVNGKPGPQESELETDKLDVFVRFARDAVAGRKQMVVTHSEIFLEHLPAPPKPPTIFSLSSDYIDAPCSAGDRCRHNNSAKSVPGSFA
jgi:hypothetical protein